MQILLICFTISCKSKASDCEISVSDICWTEARRADIYCLGLPAPTPPSFDNSTSTALYLESHTPTLALCMGKVGSGRAGLTPDPPAPGLDMRPRYCHQYIPPPGPSDGFRDNHVREADHWNSVQQFLTFKKYQFFPSRLLN